MTPRNPYFAPSVAPRPRLGDQEVIDVGYIEKQQRQVPGPVPRPARADDLDYLRLARLTPSASWPRWRRTRPGGAGSTPATPTCRWRSGPRSSWPSARRLSPSTQETYRRDLTKYVLPTLGAYRLGAIPPDQIENWLNDELDAGIAPSSVHRHYRTLRRVLQVAVDKQEILANPCDRVEPPRVPKREMVFIDWAQAVDLAEAHTRRSERRARLASPCR